MGCYGIGVSRLIGTIAEHFSDEKGLVWSDSVAPFRVYMAQIGDVAEAAQALYDQLVGAGVSVLWDDRDTRPGDKFADADLMGLPHRIVISPKTVELHQIEYKSRTSDKVEMLSTEELIKRLS
jgi:prolyl-tRNA synthetase